MAARRAWLLILLLAVWIAPPGRAQRGAAPSPEALMGQALHQQDVDGDLRAAIATYARVIADPRATRKTIATALLYQGQCHERLGATESRQAYERIVREFGDQPDVVALARGRLARTDGAGPARASHDRVWTMARPGPSARVARSGLHVLAIEDGQEGMGLLVRDLGAGTDRRALMRDRAVFWAVIAPDGSQVACLSFSSRGWSFDLVDWPSGSEARVRSLFEASTELDVPLPLDWAPDGRSIAVGVFNPDGPGQAAATGRLGILTIADRRIETLVTLPPEGVKLALQRSSSIDYLAPEFVKGVFSPDGRQFAFDLPVGGPMNRDIFVVGVAPGAQIGRPIVAAGIDETLVGWSPDGTSLVYVAAGSGGTELTAQSIKDGRAQGSPRSLMALGDPTAEAMLGLTRDGTAYRASCVGCRGLLKLVDFDPTTGAIVAPALVLDSFVNVTSFAAWSNDGRFLAHISRKVRDGTREAIALSIRTMTTGDVREIVPRLGELRAPLWSRDGSYLIVAGEDLQGIQGLYRVDPGTGAVSPVHAIGPSDRVYLPQWSTDGARIYFRVDSGGRTTLVERHMRTDVTREVFSRELSTMPGTNTNGFSGVLVPPARDRIALSTLGTPASIDIVRLADGHRTPVATLPPGLGLAGAPFPSRDGAHLAAIVTDPAQGRSRLVLVSTQTGDMKDLMTGALRPELPAIWWLPDSRSLLFRRTVSAGVTDMWRVPVDGSAPHRLALDPTVLMTVVGVRPDGRQIAFAVPPSSPVVEVWATRNLFPPRQP